MTHKRQNSTGNFSSGLNVDQNNPLETSFSSLAYFMNVSKMMVTRLIDQLGGKVESRGF